MIRQLVFAACVLVAASSGLRAQSASATPDQNPTGNAGALKPQVQTGGSYDAHSGNGTRIVNDLKFAGALGAYGLDFTRYWNSTHNDYIDPEMEWPRDFGDSGWSHSWHWTAQYSFKYPEEVPGTDHDNNQWTTAINITFPDGHTTQYKIVRLGHGEWMVPGDPRFGPPYSEGEKRVFAYGGSGVHDHICNLATDGSEFWLCRADGGSVHFVWDVNLGFLATQVFDPHGFETTLKYDAGGWLETVEQPGGRYLRINWLNFGGGGRFIGSVQSFSGLGSSPSQTVSYTYTVVPHTWGVGLQTVTYENELDPSPGGGPIKAQYHYSHCWAEEPCSDSGGSLWPLLKRADDPHYAGAMRTIRYDYRAVECPELKVRPWDHPNYVRAQPFAILAEKSDSGIAVSRFQIHCDGGLRQEVNGLGASRTFYFGTSGQTYELGDGEAYTAWGYQLAKLTDFWRFGEPAPPYERQNYLGGHPRHIWDGRNIKTVSIVAGGDDSGQPAEIRRADGSVDYYNRVDPSVSGSAPIDPNQGMHNLYNHWVFSETHHINATTTHTTYYKRDARRRVTDITYPDGSHELFTYNNFNQVLTRTLPSGAVITKTYDNRGLLVQESHSVEAADYTTYTYYVPNDPEGPPDPQGRSAWTDLVKTTQNARARVAGTFATKLQYNGRHQITRIEYPNTAQTACATAPTPPPPTPAPTPTPTATATATPTATATATLPPTPVADPVFSPDGGTYPSTPPTDVTISTATVGAHIRYTLDGTTPTKTYGILIAASSGTVPVTSTAGGTILKAIAFRTGWINSSVKSATYLKPQVADPAFTPDGGTYPSPTTVTITSSTAGASIRYTLDGSIPTETDGTLIAASSGSVSVSSTAQGAVLKAVAFQSGWTTSGVKSATYFKPQVTDPVISPNGGTFPSTQPVSVTITTSTAGANIRYTLDGTAPSESTGTLIAASSGTVSVTSSPQGTVLKAVAVKAGWTNSAVKSSSPYTMPQVAAPTFNPDGGISPGNQPVSVTITTGTAGANIRYTLDGTTPTATNGTLIAASSGTASVTTTGPGTVLKAVAFKSGWTTSGIKSATYSMPWAAEPVFDPGGFVYESAPGPVTVTITTTTPGANIRYTVDGTNPTESHGTLIPASSGTASVTPTPYQNGGTQLKAVAFKPGWRTSAAHTENYSYGDLSWDPCYPVAYPGCDCPPEASCGPPPID